MPDFKKSEKRKGPLQAGICNGLAQINEIRENWLEAKKQLEAWLKLDPNSAMAMQQLAMCLVRQKDLTGVLEELKKAAQIDSSILTPEALLARLCEQVGDRENAKKYMGLALAEKPKDLRTRLTAAHWAYDTGQLDEAQTQAAAAMKIDEKSLDAKIIRGVVARFRRITGRPSAIRRMPTSKPATTSWPATS